MRIVSWNVNGLYTTLKDATHRFTNASIYFTTILHADLVCFQVLHFLLAIGGSSIVVTLLEYAPLHVRGIPNLRTILPVDGIGRKEPCFKNAREKGGTLFCSSGQVFSFFVVRTLQEAKIQEEKLEKWMACVPGFESFWAFSQAKKGYSGVVTYVKDNLSPLDAAADKFPGTASDIEDLCREGRMVETDHGSFVLINIYVPNAGDREEGRPRLEFKVRFLQALKQKCDELVSSGRHVIVVGDFNIAHKAIDVHKKWNIDEIYSPEEKVWLDNFLTEYVDLFRHFHPDVKDVFSVWEARTDARIHNEGLRIDYAVCDKGFLSQVNDTQILKMVPKNWSDHAAVVLTLQDQPVFHPHPSPSISSRNMKRFQEDRRQKKLTSLFSRGASKSMSASNLTSTVHTKQDHLEQGKTGGSRQELVAPSPKQSTAVGERLEQCPDREEQTSLDREQQGRPETQQQGLSPSGKRPLCTKDLSLEDGEVNDEAAGNLRQLLNSTGQQSEGIQKHQQEVRETAGSNENLGEELRNATEEQVGSVQNPQQEISKDKEPDHKFLNMHPIINSEVEHTLILPAVQPQVDVEVAVESGTSSPLKRKHSSEPLTETGVSTVKQQKSLNAYFKMSTDDS